LTEKSNIIPAEEVPAISFEAGRNKKIREKKTQRRQRKGVHPKKQPDSI